MNNDELRRFKDAPATAGVKMGDHEKRSPERRAATEDESARTGSVAPTDVQEASPNGAENAGDPLQQIGLLLREWGRRFRERDAGAGSHES
jgi:hypothetical protein